MSNFDRPPRRLVIIGAGFSGAVLAARILRGAPAGGWHVILIERRSRFARGLAYHTWDDNLLLNVPAGNMSALAEQPGDFVDFCRSIDPAFNSGSFVSRRIYGDYLEHTLAAAERGSASRLERCRDEVVGVERIAAAGGFRVALASGPSLVAERVALALGHFPPRWPAGLGLAEHDACVGNPWDFEALDRIPSSRSVAILGAGHTAIDVLFRLTSASDRRKVYLVSRRGLLPHGHRMNPHPPAATPEYPQYLRGLPATLRAHVRAIRREAQRGVAAGGDWRDVLNGLRPHTPAIWERLPTPERRKFLGRIVPYWDIHRHRLAPAAYLRFQQMLQSGQAEALTGRVGHAVRLGRDVELEVILRGGDIRRLQVAAVVNCTGPNCDVATLELPLLAGLRADGLMTPDAVRIGLRVDEHYQVVAGDGASVPGLFYLGPMLKARYWEAIAVPELRVHAARLSRTILESSAPPRE